MPFAYYGAKHGLAKKYPRPVHDLIIEPFAGAAGYSCHWAHLGRQVLLNDLSPDTVGLWRRLLTITTDEVMAIRADVVRTREVLVASIGGGTQWDGIMAGRDRQVTPRMAQDWQRVVRPRILAVLPFIGSWRIQDGDYRDLPDLEATWFIDPPYEPIISTAGDDYAAGSSGIDYEELAGWCQSRRGQVIVCEQSPADWLPFTPLARQTNGKGTDTRTEVVWLSDQQQLSLLDPLDSGDKRLYD